MSPKWKEQKACLSDAFREQGFVHIENFFKPDICLEAIGAINALETTLTASNTVNIVTEIIDNKVYVKYYQGIYSENPAFRKFFSLELLELASCLLQTSELYFADIEAHLRNPGGGEIPKHQDNFYFNLKNAVGLTVYIALSSHDANSGGLNYLSRSHSSVISHSPSSSPGFSSFVPDDLLVAPKEAARKVYTPKYNVGDISIHHPNNLHWSKPSPHTAPRGYALSARIFSLNETIDPEGRERYLKLLAKNRSN